MASPVVTRAGARLSACGAYRYELTREWGRPMFGIGGRCLFVMLNPSTADGSEDDPTIRRCLGFAAQWDFDSLEVVNLFALRATDPAELYKHPDPVGPENDAAILAAAARANQIVVAWGGHGAHLDRAAAVARLLASYRLLALRTTREGHPGHPLYVPASAGLIEWWVPATDLAACRATEA